MCIGKTRTSSGEWRENKNGRVRAKLNRKRTFRFEFRNSNGQSCLCTSSWLKISLALTQANSRRTSTHRHKIKVWHIQRGAQQRIRVKNELSVEYAKGWTKRLFERSTKTDCETAKLRILLTIYRTLFTYFLLYTQFEWTHLPSSSSSSYLFYLISQERSACSHLCIVVGALCFLNVFK